MWPVPNTLLGLTMAWQDRDAGQGENGMNRKTQLSSFLMLPMMLLACTAEPPPQQAEAEQPIDSNAPPPAIEPLASVPAATTATASVVPDAPSGSMVVYTCDNGSSLTVTYDQYGALVKLPTGSTMLPRAESASNGYDEAYLGEELSLYRTGGVVQLQLSGKARNCTRASAG